MAEKLRTEISVVRTDDLDTVLCEAFDKQGRLVTTLNLGEAKREKPAEPGPETGTDAGPEGAEDEQK